MSNNLRTRNGMPFNFVNGLKVRGMDIESLIPGIEGIPEAGSKYQFAGDGTNKSFTLPVSPYNKDAVDVYVKQLYVHPDDYTLVGDTVTLAEAPPAVVAGETYNVVIKVSLTTLNGYVNANRVSFEGENLDDILEKGKPLANYSNLRAYAGAATQVRITDPGIAGFFYYDPLDTVSVDNGGTTIVASNGKRWKRVFDGAVSVKWFGAVGDWNGTTGTNDSAAFQLAINSSGVVDLVPGKNYLLSSAVTVTSHRIINGNGATITVGTNAAFNPTAPIEIYNVNFQSTSSGTSKGLAVNAQANALDGTVIQGCKFGRVQIALFDSNVSDATANNSRIRILNNTFTGNYTGVPSGDVNNVVSVRGAVDIFIDGNSFDVVGIERFIKLSDSCRRVFIRGNSFKCLTTTVGKQAIDLFADTREVVVADNIANLSGFVAFVENKNGDNNVDYAEPSEMLVNGNIIKMAGAITTMSPIAIYGAWGLTEQTLNICIAKVFGNKILQAGTGATSATIVVRGMTHADVTGNTLWRDDNPDYARGIEVSNCKREIVVGNQIEHGNISVSLNAQHPGGTTYANPPLDVLIANNQIISFGALDGVYIHGSGTTTDRVVINGNSFYPKSGTGSSGVILVAGVTITDLSVLSNYGKSLTTADVVVTNSGAITETRISGNSWQGGRTTSTPGTIISGGSYTINITVPGAEVGDSLQIGLPYDMQGANVEARVSASNNVRILIRNQTAGSLTFAGGTFSARVARG